MAVQLRISFDTLRELIRQLPEGERRQLLSELSEDLSQERELTIQERIALLNMMKLSHTVQEDPSVRRQDWYDDDGR